MEPNPQQPNQGVWITSSPPSQEVGSLKTTTIQVIIESIIAIVLIVGWLVLLLTHTVVPGTYEVLTAGIAGHSVGTSLGSR